jgi:hypothetical protein
LIKVALKIFLGKRFGIPESLMWTMDDSS